MKILHAVIVGILILYFQFLVAPHLASFNIIPIFLIAYIIYTTIKLGIKTTLSIAFFIGLAYDLLTPNLLGLNALSFIVIVYLVGNFEESINKNRFAVILIAITFLNLLYYLLQAAYYLLSGEVSADFSRLFIWAVIYNSIITIISLYFLALLSKLRIILNV